MMYYVSIVVCFSLTVLAIKYPSSLLVSYFLIASFFQPALPGVGVGYLVLITVILFVVYLIRFKRIYWNRQVRVYCIILLFSWSMPSLYHWIVWGKISPYTTDFMMSLWGFLFLLMPLRKLSPKNLALSGVIVFAVAAALIAYESIPYYFQTGRGLGRSVNYISQKIAEGESVREIDQQLVLNSPFAMKIPQSIYMSVLASFPATLLLYSMVVGNLKNIFIFGSLSALGGMVFYCNQYFNAILTVVVIMVVVLVAIHRVLPTRYVKRGDLILLVMTIGIIAAGTCYWTELIVNIGYKFDMTAGSMSRMDRFVRTVSQLVSVQAITGVGMSKPNVSIYYAISDSGYLSGHSTIIDQLFGFGLLFGFLSILVYIYPFWMMTKKTLRRKMPANFYLILIAIFSSAIFQALVNIFGQNKNQLGFYIGLTVLMLRLGYDQKDGIDVADVKMKALNSLRGDTKA